MEKEMEKRIIEQLLLKPRKLVSAEDIGGDKSRLFGNGKNVWGIAKKVRGDISEIEGNIGGIGNGDISRFVGNVSGIKGNVDEITAVLEKTKRVIKQRV